MITINLYNDGAYIKGHDINEICTLISYAMWACINDCHRESQNVCFYESVNDPKWKTLGFTYIKIDENCLEHVKILERFKMNLSYWLEIIFPEIVKVNNIDQKIEWKTALEDAKNEHFTK